MEASTSTTNTANPFAFEHRTDEILLKLLDGIEHDVTEDKLPSPRVDAFESLCRAVRARSGR